MSKKYIGTTIHTGWFPLLTSGSPQRAFHKSKSARGVAARGYNESFIKHVQAVVDKRGKNETLDILDEQKVTKTWKQAEHIAESEYGEGFETEDYRGSLFGRKHRAAGWADARMEPKKGEDGKKIYDDASRLEDTMKKFQLRGNFVWYNRPKGGPKALAQAIISNNFNFGRAEKWYKGSFSSAGGNMSRWASDTLGIDKADFIDPKEVEDVGKAVGEVVFKGGELEKVDKYDAEVKAEPRDMKFEGGPAEISEMQMDERHGYPPVSSEDKKTNQALKTVLDNHAINVWNKTVDKLIEKAKKDLKTKTGKKPSTKAAGTHVIKQSSGDLAKGIAAEISPKIIRRIKHEIADKIKGFGAKQANSEWTDILRANNKVDKQTGQKKYFKIDLEMDNKFHFTVNSVKSVSGIEAGQAMISDFKSSMTTKSLRNSLNQQIGFAHQYGKNTGTITKHNSMTMQTLNNMNQGITHKTAVSFSPKIGKEYVDGIIDRIGELTEKNLTGKEKEIQDAVYRKAVKYNKYGGIFWAAPYIGIEEGLNLG